MRSSSKRFVRLPDLRFLFDADISWRLAEVLRAINDSEDIECVGKPPCPILANASDLEVIAYAVQSNRILISKDDRQLGTIPTTRHFLSLGARAIYVTGSLPESHPVDAVVWMIRKWPRICDAASALDPGQAVKITKSGLLRVITVRLPN